MCFQVIHTWGVDHFFLAVAVIDKFVYLHGTNVEKVSNHSDF